MFKHVLVPTDGSDLSDGAVSAALQFAKLLGARVTAVYAMARPDSSSFSVYNPAPGMTEEEFRADENNKAQQIVARVEARARAAGVSCDSVCVSGDAPYEVIIETARDKGCDLIFMASHGRRGISALVLGSETNKVLTHCTIPVMVYR